MSISNETISDDEIIDDPDYWLAKANRSPDLLIRESCCGDCPADGMYLGYVEGLKKQPDNVRFAVSKTWFCHTNPQYCCYGNLKAQGFVEESNND